MDAKTTHQRRTPLKGEQQNKKIIFDQDSIPILPLSNEESVRLMLLYMEYFSFSKLSDPGTI
jgi:hypothetical protein